MNLTREQILGLIDLTTKEITVPEHIPGWGGNKFFIKQLSRGVQDAYLQRQFGSTKMRQDARQRSAELSLPNLYGGHDTWLCIQGLCYEDGKPLFSETDASKLATKNGEAIGWIALQILEFSGMAEDAKVASGELTNSEALSEEIKK